MNDLLQNFAGWYLAPWRRINRKHFAIGLTLATIPGLIIMVTGFGSGASHFLGPLMSLGGMEGQMNDAINRGDVASLQNQMQNMQSPLEGLGGLFGGSNTPQQFSIDWTGVINNILLLAVLPLTRMRLHDMGWWGKPELAITVLLNLSVANGLITSLTGYSPLPMAFLFGVINFLGYMWLSMAKGTTYQAVNERTDFTFREPEAPNETPKRDDDDRYY